MIIGDLRRDLDSHWFIVETRERHRAELADDLDRVFPHTRAKVPAGRAEGTRWCFKGKVNNILNLESSAGEALRRTQPSSIAPRVGQRANEMVKEVQLVRSVKINSKLVNEDEVEMPFIGETFAELQKFDVMPSSTQGVFHELVKPQRVVLW